MQVNTDVLDTVLLSLHPAEVNTDKKAPTNKKVPFKVIAATEDVSERSRIGLAQLHRYLPSPRTLIPMLTPGSTPSSSWRRWRRRR